MTTPVFRSAVAYIDQFLADDPSNLPAYQYYCDVAVPEGMAVEDVVIFAGEYLVPLDPTWVNAFDPGPGSSNTFFYKFVTSTDVAAGTFRFILNDEEPATEIPPTLLMSCYSGVSTVAKSPPPVPGIGSSTALESLSITAPSLTARVDAIAVNVFFWSTGLDFGTAPAFSSLTGTHTVRVSAQDTMWQGQGGVIADQALSANDSSFMSCTITAADLTTGMFAQIFMLEGSHPPNTPAITSPAAASTYTTLEDVPLQLSAFTDIDVGDSASASGFQYELVSGGTWAPIVGDTDGSGVIPAGTLTAGSWEVAGTYTDQGSLTSAFSPSRDFTVIDPPTAPAITVPTSGATITAPTASETFTVTSSDGYQRQLVGDDAGDPDPTVIYADTGLIAASGGQTVTGSYPVNNVPAHVRYRIILGGHYSAWVSVPVTVAYTLPDKPVITGITEDPEDAKIVVDYTCAVDSIPSDATAISVWASSDDFLTEFEAVTQTDLLDPLPITAGSAPWHLPACKTGYSFKVRATNAYGAINDSDASGSTTGTARDMRTRILRAGGAPPA